MNQKEGEWIKIVEMEEKYILFNPFFTLHIFPEGGFIFREMSKTPESLIGKENLITKGTWFINKKAAEFFYLCDGKKTLKEIMKTLYPEIDYNYLIEKISPFINEAIRNQDILLFSSPFLRKRKVTGSFDHFYPLHVALELTYLCNLRCEHCYALASKDNKKFLSFEEIKNMLNFLKEKGLRIIELTGGEPFLHPDFYQILKFCLENFEYVSILTNGTLVNENNVEIFKEYKNKILINISLDGPNAEIHDKKRGISGSFEKTLSSIQIFRKIGCFVRVSMSVYPDTVRYIEDTLKIAIEKGANKFVWNSVLPFGRGKDIKWKKDKGREIFEIENEIIFKYKNFIQIIEKEEMENMRKYQNCGGGWRSIVIDPEGNIKPCVFIKKEECIIGNLIKENPEDIFKKERILKFYKLSLPKKEICDECENLYYCEFCFARAISKYKEKGKKECKWAEVVKIEEIFNLKNENS